MRKSTREPNQASVVARGQAGSIPGCAAKALTNPSASIQLGGLERGDRKK